MCLSVVDMRKIGSSRGAVTAYPRQLESLIRLAEAHAKMRSGTTSPVYMVLDVILFGMLVRFSGTVEIVDVEEAKRLGW